MKTFTITFVGIMINALCFVYAHKECRNSYSDLKVEQPDEPAIKISVRENNWIEVIDFGGSSVCYCNINYEKVDYTEDEVTVVCEMTIQGDSSKTKNRTSYKVEVPTPTGQIFATFIVQKKLIGQGNLDLFLTDEDEKVISNIFTIPVAAGDKAKQDLEKKWGHLSARKTNKLIVVGNYFLS